MSSISQPESESSFGEGITDEQVDSVLHLLRERPLFVRFTDQKWDGLPFPLRHFIETTAYEASPDDPFQREQVANSMLGMFVLLQEVRNIHQPDSSELDTPPAA